MNKETKLKIGELELGQGLILAPMAGITDLSFRRIAKSFDVDLVTSEMVSSEGLVRNRASTKMLLQSHVEETRSTSKLFAILRKLRSVIPAMGARINPCPSSSSPILSFVSLFTSKYFSH